VQTNAQMQPVQEVQATVDSTVHPEYAGAFIDYQQNIFSANLTGIPGTPSCCPQYNGGGGSGFTIGGMYEFALSEMWFMQLRAAYAIHNGTLTALESKDVLVNGAPLAAVIEHRIDARISTLGLEAFAGTSPLERLGVYFGGIISYQFQPDFDQKETLVQPEGVGTFENNSRVRNVSLHQSIPNASPIYAGLTGLAAYTLPLSKGGNWFIVPELSYTLAMTRIASDIAWKANIFRVGASIQYAIRAMIEPPPPIVLPPPVKPPPPQLVAAINAVGLDSTGGVTNTANIVVEEFESIAVRPLLTYIFFDENEAELSHRYTQLNDVEAQSFSIDRLHGSTTLDVYHNILNIMGLRLTENPSATISITGCNTATGKEVGNISLSKMRAETVAKYLTDIWKIQPFRMHIDARNLPSTPSNIGDAEGQAENRRVEITSDNESILDPIVTHDIERHVIPGTIRFLPSIISEAGIKAWTLTITHDQKTVRTFSGSSEVDPDIDWNFANDLPSSTGSVSYKLIASDFAGQQEESAIGSIDINEITVHKKRLEHTEDKVISRFDLILFDFDSPILGHRNDRIVERYIHPEMKAQAKVHIAGYTDRIGDETHNAKLSLQRAQNVAKTLHIVPNQIEGKGEDSPLQSNESPEGRFYNRTVEVTVETATK